jgi:hypothetical protein
MPKIAGVPIVFGLGVWLAGINQDGLDRILTDAAASTLVALGVAALAMRGDR